MKNESNSFSRNTISTELKGGRIGKILRMKNVSLFYSSPTFFNPFYYFFPFLYVWREIKSVILFDSFKYPRFAGICVCISIQRIIHMLWETYSVKKCRFAMRIGNVEIEKWELCWSGPKHREEHTIHNFLHFFICRHPSFFSSSLCIWIFVQQPFPLICEWIKSDGREEMCVSVFVSWREKKKASAMQTNTESFCIKLKGREISHETDQIVLPSLVNPFGTFGEGRRMPLSVWFCISGEVSSSLNDEKRKRGSVTC